MIRVIKILIKFAPDIIQIRGVIPPITCFKTILNNFFTNFTNFKSL